MRRARRTHPAPRPLPPRFSLAEQTDTRTAVADAVTAWAAQRGALTIAIALNVGPRLP